METKKTIYQLHEEHKTWLNKLLFYKDELNSIDNENFSDHKKHRESIAVFEKLFRELREELIDFLSKWM